LSHNRRLVVNADDFGFTRDVNAGIIEAHTRGILTATTLMANGDAFDHAVDLAREYPTLDVGCHLVLIGGRSLVTGLPLPPSAPALLQTLALGRLSVREELRAQIEKIFAAGLRPTHLDTHKHTHLLPPVLSVVADLAREFSIPWVRRPFDCPALRGIGATPLQKQWLSWSINRAENNHVAIVRQHQLRCTDYFAGFQLTGYLDTAALVEVIRRLPPGTTELMCHPGRLGAELQQAPTRLKQSRQIELDALTAPAVRMALQEAEVDLLRYRDLPV